VKMLADENSAKDPAIMDPLEVIASLQNAMNLRAEVDRLSAASISQAESAEENQFRIRIYITNNIYRSELGETILDKLREQGPCTIMSIMHNPVSGAKQEQRTA